MFRALSAATAFVAFGAAEATLVDIADDLVNACDDDALSFIQLRAGQHHQRAQHEVQSEWGHEVKDRPLVDKSECDVWGIEDGKSVLSEGICPLMVMDSVLGDARNGVPAQVVTGVRFFVKQAGNFGLRFVVFRNNGILSEQTEEIDVPVAGVIQEYTFKQPLFLMYEDIIGFIHNGNGNIAYSEGSDSGHGSVLWDGDIQPCPHCYAGRVQIWQEEVHGTCGLFRQRPASFHRRLVQPTHQPRTYSYSLFVRPASKADVPDPLCLPRSGKAVAPPQTLLDSLPDEVPMPDPVPAAAERDAAADSCGNCAAGYTCTAGSIGVSRVQLIRDLGCRGEPDMWVCSVAKAKVACDADETCNSFAVSDKWGLNKAQLFGASDGTPNAGWTLWSVDAGAPECPPDVDEASAAGDPHLITNTGKHYDYTTK